MAHFVANRCHTRVSSEPGSRSSPDRVAVPPSRMTAESRRRLLIAGKEDQVYVEPEHGMVRPHFPENPHVFRGKRAVTQRNPEKHGLKTFDILCAAVSSSGTDTPIPGFPCSAWDAC